MSKSKIFIVLAILGVVSFAIGRPPARKHTVLQSNGASIEKSSEKLTVDNIVQKTEEDGHIVIHSNGIPNHKVGSFPNSGNPNKIQSQKNVFRFPKNPKKNKSLTKLEMAFDFGVAVNGVPFDPGAAEWYQGVRNSDWRYEALSGAVPLGIDESHAHVQPTGAYHYHGMPSKLLEKLNFRRGEPSPLIGYAADGFKIYALYGKDGQQMTSSYQLKKGSRPIGGEYDGTFVTDYEYVKGHGNLDECNGVEYKGEYAYFLTEKFPVIPRCFMGTPDVSFRRGRGPQPRNRVAGRGHTHGRGMHRHDSRGGPPPEARSACHGKSEGESCSFKTPHGELGGSCFYPPGTDELICRP